MSRWTDEELRELVNLVADEHGRTIAYRLHRPRAAVCGKAKRLLQKGLLQGKNAKHPNPRKRRTRAQPTANPDHAAAATSRRQPRDAVLFNP